jgi:hypothetical protein
MKILVATGLTQGSRATDFNFAVEGEIVGRDDEHTSDEERPEAECGCQRSLVGVESQCSTTTFQVIESGYTPEEFEGIIREARREGVAAGADADNIRAEIALLLEVASRFPAGAVVERRGDVFEQREL